MSDRLAALFAQFGVAARVFHAGALCGVNDVGDVDGPGHLHLVRGGRVEVVHGAATVQVIERPSLLLYPRALPHRFVTDAGRGADLACAELHFDGGAGNPIAGALPAWTCLPLEQVPGAAPVLALLFEEAFERRCGRDALLDRLFEVVLIQVLRALMEGAQTSIGMLAGMAHPRLRHALVAIHESPAEPWTLETLAARAGMSRSAFADAFRVAVGSTPGGYLQAWRIGLAARALRAGRPLKLVAGEVGYASEAALSRAFKAQSGMSPRQWTRQVPAMARGDRRLPARA